MAAEKVIETVRAAHGQTLDTEGRIKTAAIELFSRQGFSATGMRDIASAAGLTNAGVYHHVANKESLLLEIMQSGQKTLTEAAMRSLEGVERPEERLAVLISSLVLAHGVNPKTTRVSDVEVRSLAAGSESRTVMVELRDRYERLWRDAIALGVEQGIFTIEDQRLTRLALIAMCTGMSEWYRPGGPADLDYVCRYFIGLGLRQVQASRGGVPVTPDDLPAVEAARTPKGRWEPANSEPDREEGVA